MAYLALVNPSKRRKSRKASGARKTKKSRRRNPAPLAAVRRVTRRAGARRRRNPIVPGNLLGGIVPLVRDAAIGAAGAHAIDYAYGRLSPMLPAQLQAGYVGNAVKGLVTIVLGRVLNKPTKGLSMQAARGALAVQMYGVIGGLIAQSTAAGIGYASPLPIVQSNVRFNPTGRSTAMGRISNTRTPQVGLGRVIPVATPTVARAPSTAAI